MVFLRDVTVAIPLHRGKVWSEVVFSNIEALSTVCQVIVSDCTEEDSLLQELVARFSGIENIQFLGRRELESGWIAHWNDLLSRIETDFFMWLPQDDEVGSDWIVRNRNSLLEKPELAGAFGRIHKIFEDGSTEPIGVPMPTTIDPKYPQAFELLGRWNLGIAMRSVWRKSKVLPILETKPPNGEWADIVWIYGILLQHQVVQIQDVIYKKRWHFESAHARWRPFISLLAFRFLLREITRRKLSNLMYFRLLLICLKQSAIVSIKILGRKILSYYKMRHSKR